MAGRGSFAFVQGAVGWHDQTDEEEVDNVEDEDTPDDLLRGPWDLLDWVLGLGCGKTDELSAGVGERSSDENTTEAVEAIEEGRVGSVPIPSCQTH